MDLNAVKIFVKTSELMSFTGAAAALNMTQSGVSRAISRLESDLEVKLLNRTTRSLSLTPDGQAFCERCSALLLEFEDAQQQLTSQRERPSGVLKVSAPLGFGRTVLMPILAQLSKDNPGLTMEVAMTDRLVDLTAEGFDAAIRIGEIPDSRVVARQLGNIKLVTVASASYLDKFGTPSSPDDLKEHNCLNLRYPRTGRLYQWLFKQGAQERKLAVTGDMVLDIGEGLMDLAIQGHGIVQTQQVIAAQALKNKQVVPILTEYALDRGPVSLVYPQSKHLSSKIRVLKEALSDLKL